MILEKAVSSPGLRQQLVAIFNDANLEFADTLRLEIEALPGVDRLRFKPEVITGEVTEARIAKFETYAFPALSFVDPWGYRGLSLRLLRAVTRNWGCDAIFFFNYNRINMDITNNIVEPHMEAIFGRERLEKLRQELPGLTSAKRELVIKRTLGDAVKEIGAPLLIPFTFRGPGGRTSHYVCFLTKDPLGYGIMKDIMARRGAVDEDGVPLFEYIPASGGHQLAFDTPRPIGRLADDLLREFSGQTLTFREVFDRHNVGTPFVKPNYRRVLLDLEERGEISCRPHPRRAGTLAQTVRITFPFWQRSA